MASRLFGGSKSSKSSKVKSPDPLERSSALPKRSGIPTPPQHSSGQSLKPSLLPKNAAKGGTERAPAVAQPSAGRSGASRSTAVAKAPSSSLGASKPPRPPVPTHGIPVRAEVAPTAPPARTRLRRKASSQDQYSQYAKSETSGSSREQYPAPSQPPSSDWEITDPHPGTLLGIPMPPPVCEAPLYPATTAIVHPMEATSNSRMNLYNAGQQLPKLTTPDPPSIPVGSSGTPSTRFSGSPGNFSRGSTPTSASSYSPSLMQTPKFGSRTRPSMSPASASRPPVVRRMAGTTPQREERANEAGLPSVRESQTSSSSSSPVKALEQAEQAEPIESIMRKSKKPAPTPPLRLSSKRGPNPRLKPSAIVAGSSTSSVDTLPVAVASENIASQISIGPLKPFNTNATTSSVPVPTSREGSRAPPTSRIALPEHSSAQRAGQAPRNRAASAERTAIPPPRPSRDGLPALEPNESPVIQSNMTHVAVSGRTRRESLNRMAPSSFAPSSIPARTTRSRSTSVTSATSQSSLTATAPAPSQESPHLHPRNESKTNPPVPMRRDLQHSSKRDPSQSPSRSPGRFGFFSRRLKSPSETSIGSPPPPPPPPAKLHKKGPAAGTGHEGYSRHARRGRSTSIGTGRSRNPSASTDRGSIAPSQPSGSRKNSFNSSDGRPELDEFYRDRLEPITIGGGGVIRENRNSGTSLYQTASGQSSVGSFDSGRPSVDHGSLASSTNASREILPAPRLISTPHGIVQQERTIAHRRSLHRSQHFGENGVRVPPPINTKATAPSPAIDTYDSAVSSVPPTEASILSDASEGQEGNWMRPKRTPAKGKTPRRWNFFRRTTRSPEPSIQLPKPSFESERAMPATVTTAHGYGPVAHYTIMDEGDSTSEQELEDKLRTIESNLDLDMDNGMGSEAEHDRQPSMLLPPPPLRPAQFDEIIRPASPRVPLNQSPGCESGDSPRQPRLQQVGRIPRVISNRDRQQPAFSQSYPLPFPNRPSLDEDRGPYSTLEPPVLGVMTNDLSLERNTYDKPASAAALGAMPYPSEQEFLRLSPRKDSELTSGSSESGVISLVPITAIPPSSEDILSDDEIWNEYDDLIDRVSPPITTSPSVISNMLVSAPPTTALPPLPIDQMDTPRPLNYDNRIGTPIHLSHVAPGSIRVTNNSLIRHPALPNRPEQLMISIAHDSVGENPLSTPFTLSDLYSNYGNRSSIGKANQRLSNISATSGSRYSSQTIISESGSRSSVESPQVKRVTQVIAEKTYSGSSDSLRFSALMASRWLSFDRVLFSPAQGEVCNARQSRVLVLDGLGNDDWSAYCALTYPEATVYNLSPANRKFSVRDTAATANNDEWVPPPNLRRVAHSSLSAPFPFPKGFFTVVVLRFPTADTPSAYKHAISECKRVLKPGGYLELSILDIDMVNMGSRLRRRIRGVKERMAGFMPDVSLSPASDTVFKLLGRRGFENLNRCVVSVPLASSGVVGSSDLDKNMSSESPTHGDDGKHHGHRSFQELLQAHTKFPNPESQSGAPPSLADTAIHHNSPAMIGRVARWWWSRCYEAPVQQARSGRSGVPEPANGEMPSDSVWADPTLVQECTERQTGLRLVICYAQKPESVRRRTVSV